jgi:formiminoglutamase
MDGFSSAFAPGVSAPSPMGISPDIAFRIFELIASSKKLISMDVVELNPTFDQDNATARLAARCTEYILRKVFG